MKQPDGEALLRFVESAIGYADSLVGRSVAIVADSVGDPDCPESKRDQMEIARLAGLLRGALGAARAEASAAAKEG